MRRSVFVLLFVGAVCVALAAQQPPAKPQATFRTGVEYVELDAVVTDKQDRPVTDLTTDNFEIVENGRSQAIANFQFISIPPTRRAVPDVKLAAPTIDVVSNAHAPLARQWVLVIDDLHIIEQHLTATKKVVQDFLEQLTPNDQVAVVFVGRSDLSLEFTSDIGAEMRTVNRIKDALGFAPDAADDLDAHSRHFHGTASTDVLKNVVNALKASTFPRKSLVYVSEGMTYPFRPGPDDPGDIFDRFVETFKAAREAGVPVYTIDPRGLPDCTFYRDGGICTDPGGDARIMAQQDQMRTIVENTGGRAFVNMSDVPRAVRELVEDNNSFYLLGYYPEPFVADGKFHDVSVKIKGRPGLKVRARSGYAAPKASKATDEDTKLSLNAVLSAALPVPGLQLRAAAAPVAIGEKGMKTAVTLEVTYPALAHQKFEDTLLLGIVAIDHEGKVKATARGSYKYSATPKESMDVSYTINAMIDLPADPLTLRIAVASTALDRAASIHVPVEVINPNRDTLQFGSIVLGFAGPLRQTAVPPGALKGFVPVQPTMARVFSAKDTLQIYAPMFWRATDEASAIVTVAVRSEGQIVRQNRVDVTSLPAMTTILTRGRRGAFEDTLPLAQLVPGAYTLELVGHLTTGSTARREVAFEVR